MKNKYLFLAKNILLFFIASVVPKAISFLMVPLYTNELLTSEYGVADLLGNTVQILLPILTLQVQDAVLRYAMDEQYKKENVFSIGINIVLKGSLILLIGGSLFVIFGGNDLSGLYFCFILVNFFFEAINIIFSYYCRAIDEVKALTVASILATVTTVSCNLIFLTIFKWGLKGYLLGNTLGIASSAIYVFFKTKLYRDYHIKNDDKQLKKQMILFSIPMIFSAISWWINNASDKYILTFFGGASIVGVYAVAAKIPSIISTFGIIVSKAFSVSAIKELDVKDSDGFLGKSYSMISAMMTIGCSGLILCNIIISQILYSKEFFVAWKYVPLLLVAALMSQISFNCEMIFVALKETKIISRTALIAAIVNTALNIVLIPFSGAYGAAIATVIGFSVAWILRYRKLKTMVELKNNIKREVCSYVLLIIQMILAYYGNKYWLLQVICIMGIILLYTGQIKNILLQVLKKRKSF